MNEFWRNAIATHDHRLVVTLLAAGLRLDEARDVAQEAWLRLIEASASGRIEHIELPGLVIRQASYLVADRRRSAGKQRVGQLEEAQAIAAVETAESAAEARELLSLVDGTLAAGSPRSRRVFLATLNEPEMSQGVLAEREGLSLQRFRQVLCEVRARLRQAVNSR